MSKKFTRSLIMLLCIAMITALCGMSAFAEDEAAYVAEFIPEGSETGEKYTSLYDALWKASDDGGTVRLLDDVTNSEQLTVNAFYSATTVIFDLNGHNLSFKAFDDDNAYALKSIGLNGKLIITGNGSITAPGGVICVKTSVLNDPKLVIDKGVTITSESGIAIFDDCSDAEIHVYGTVITNSDKWAAIQGQGEHYYERIHGLLYIYEGATVEANAHAIYVPQGGTINITGGTIKSQDTTAIEMRKGSLNISGNPIITSNAEAYTVKPNGSGATTVGAAVAIAPYDTSTMNISISGGTFTGKEVLSYANPNKVANPNVTINVTGGKFSTDITEALTNAEVKSNIKDITVAANEDGTYGVEKRNEAFEKVAAVHKAGDKTLTFLAGINNLDYTKAGFRVTLNGQEQEIPTSTVYTALTVNGKTVNSTEKFGTKYFFAANIVINDDNIAEFTIKPFATLINGDEVSAKEPTKVTLTGGAE